MIVCITVQDTATLNYLAYDPETGAVIWVSDVSLAHCFLSQADADIAISLLAVQGIVGRPSGREGKKKA
jgi:outer membrane protein assembly factor BamB